MAANSKTVVEPIAGEPLRYHVSSQSGHPPYLVDLAAYGGNGECGCQNFEFRLKPYLERGAQPSETLECKHIREAARAFRFEMIAAIKAARGDTQNETGA